MDRNRWLIFAGLCIAIVVGLVYMSNNEKVSVDTVDAFKITTDQAINDHVYGKKDAKVVVFEYGDFQCPGCGGAFPNLQTIKETYKDSFAFVYRHFPLSAAHPHAFAAAAVSEAAAQQGKFWEMHDLLFQSQDSWKDLTAEQRQKTFEGYARQIGLDMGKFTTDVSSEKVSKKINFDRALGVKVGVNSTPSLYVNGKAVTDEIVSDLIQQKGDKFIKLINQEITKNGGSVPGTQPTTEQ